MDDWEKNLLGDYDKRQTELESMRKANPKMTTADGYEIVDRLPVWDYNLEPGYVDLSSIHKWDTDHWFNVVDSEGKKLSLMNAERVCVRHPFTGRKAEDELRLLEGEGK
jgi:hypothetical protein